MGEARNEVSRIREAGDHPNDKYLIHRFRLVVFMIFFPLVCDIYRILFSKLQVVRNRDTNNINGILKFGML